MAVGATAPLGSVQECEGGGKAPLLRTGLLCLSESVCSERWLRPAESCFGGCSVSEKVFAQRGGHVRQKVVLEAALSLRKRLLREVAMSGKK